jgi:hypothetical protein
MTCTNHTPRHAKFETQTGQSAKRMHPCQKRLGVDDVLSHSSLSYLASCIPHIGYPRSSCSGHLGRTCCYLFVTMLARESSTPMMLCFTQSPVDLVEPCRRPGRCNVLLAPDRQTFVRSILGSQSPAVSGKGRFATVELRTNPSGFAGFCCHSKCTLSELFDVPELPPAADAGGSFRSSPLDVRDISLSERSPCPRSP